jgi:hypothetical protein
VCVIVDNHIRLNYLMFATMLAFGCELVIVTDLVVVCNLVFSFQFICLLACNSAISFIYSHIFSCIIHILHANYVECLETGKVLSFFKNA